MSWPSGHLGQLEHPGNVQGSTNTSGMTIWHAGTLLAWLAYWHSRQTHGTGNQWWHYHSLNLGRPLLAHTGWCGWFMVEDGIHGDEVDVISESEQAGNLSTLRKPAQPHKPKINPNFEIWNNLEQFWDNFENFMSFYDRAFSWHLGGTSMCNIKRTVRAKTDLVNPGSLPSSYNSSVSPMPWCNV